MTSMEHARIVLILIPINEWSHFFMEDHETTGLLQTKTYFMEYVRWTMTCCGCYECSNLNCSFIKHYESSNKLQLNKNDFSCNVCGTTGEFKSSPATKVYSLMLYTPKLQYFKLATIHVMLKKHLNHRQKSAKSLFGIETSQQQRHWRLSYWLSQRENSILEICFLRSGC